MDFMDKGYLNELGDLFGGMYRQLYKDFLYDFHVTYNEICDNENQAPEAKYTKIVGELDKLFKSFSYDLITVKEKGDEEEEACKNLKIMKNIIGYLIETQYFVEKKREMRGVDA